MRPIRVLGHGINTITLVHEQTIVDYMISMQAPLVVLSSRIDYTVSSINGALVDIGDDVRNYR